jgi:hypothetical protein
MSRHGAPFQADERLDAQRRALLAGLAAGCVSPIALPAFAEAGAAQDAFLSVSRFITARAALDGDQAARLYDALAADAATFATDVQRLRDWIGARKLAAGELQHALDADRSPFAALPRKIATAWYTGIVGEGASARCVGFETSLMHRVVADRLRPPSYCYGPYGSWAEAPV